MLRKDLAAGFDCATGQVLFARELPQKLSEREEVVTGWVPEPPGVWFVGSGRAQLIAKDGKERLRLAVGPGVLPLARGIRLSSSYPLALGWVRRIEEIDPATGATSASQSLGPSELRIAEDGTPIVLAPGSESNRSGGFVAVPKRFRFTRDPKGSHAELDGQPVLKTSGDAWVLGEHMSLREVILVVAESRRDAPDHIHLVRAPR